MISITCEDSTVEQEIRQMAEAEDWEGIRETQELAHECGILVVLAENIPTTPKLSQAGRSMKTKLRDERRRTRTEVKKVEQPTLLKNKFVEALLNHPASRDAMEKAALIQIRALRRRAAEAPERKEMLGIMIEVVRSLGPISPERFRNIMYRTGGDK